SETKDRHIFLSTQTADLTSALNKTKQVEKELRSIIEREFDAAFAKIENGFSEYFSLIFSGGRASLELHKESELENLNEEIISTLSEEEKDKLAQTFNIGIEIKAAPPGKRVSNINMLSGGERALTSIALICAIIRANPSPFVVLDEVDAALDEANSERFANILEKLSHYTQFIAITHNRATMEKANILYGITMGDDGVSKLLSVDLEKAVESSKK
ncbi:MAG: AAA family ATPase, partial [Candidatus Komeilibacteria bacterium]|nr:AAA family ATPase [Candidatus Komeilibacteria bacterium]